jgi:LPXTG-motif cell wall-anchored protein
VVVLALPAAAVADSAGDNQYQDPFGNSPQQTQPKKKSPQPVSGNSQTSSPSTPAAAQPTAQAPQAASAQPAAASGQLPHTGVDARLLAAVGAALLAAGLALRRLA